MAEDDDIITLDDEQTISDVTSGSLSPFLEGSSISGLSLRERNAFTVSLEIEAKNEIIRRKNREVLERDEVIATLKLDLEQRDKMIQMLQNRLSGND